MFAFSSRSRIPGCRATCLSISNPRMSSARPSSMLHGPMLVVAGAGTGKTTVLARRIAHLIESEAARPKEILAVTYTRNAAAQLIAKVGEILYPHLDQASAARKLIASGLRPHTFHSYCYGLLHDANIQFALLDEKDLQILLRRRIQDLPLKRFIKAAAPGEFLKDLLEFFRSCHDELRTPDDYDAYVKRLERRGDSAAAGREVERCRSHAGRGSAGALPRDRAGLPLCRRPAEAGRPGNLRPHHHARGRYAQPPSVGVATRAKTRPLHSDRRVSGLQRRPDSACQAACRGRRERICGRRSRPGDLSFSRRHQRGLRPVSENVRSCPR